MKRINESDEHKDISEYTKEELNQLYKNDIYDLCVKNDIAVTNKETKTLMIKKILKHEKQREEHQQQIESNTLTDYNQGALEYALPWIIIARILKEACETKCIAKCTCVNSKAYSDAVANRTRFEFDLNSSRGVVTDTSFQASMLGDSDSADNIQDQTVFGYIQMNPFIKKHEIKQDDLCPLHKFTVGMGCQPSFNFDEYRRFSHSTFMDDSKRWTRSLGLVSKRLFSYVSTHLFTNIAIEPTDEMWSHIKDEHCIIKKATTLTVMPVPSGSTPKFFVDNTFSSKEMFVGVEKVYIKGSHLLEKVEHIRKLGVAMPKLKSIVPYTDTKPSKYMVKALFTTFDNLTSINLLNTGSLSDEIAQIRSLPSTTKLTKILLPVYFDWNSMQSELKQNLQTISMHPKLIVYPNTVDIDYKEIQQQDFPKLKHVYISYLVNMHPNWDDLVVPESVKKLSFNLPLPNVSPLVRNPHVRTVRFRAIKNRKVQDSLINRNIAYYFNVEDLKLLKFNQTSLTKIIIDSANDINHLQVNRFKSMGYQYTGSIFTTPDSLKKLQFKKLINNINNINNNNNDNNTLSSSTTTTTVINNINNNNNDKVEVEMKVGDNSKQLPNNIIRQIISMVWDLRDRCTCIYDINILNQWNEKGMEILNDEALIESFFAIKNQCAVHFSTKTTYSPLGLNGRQVNRSRLQLSLISKDLFKHIQSNHFNNILMVNVPDRRDTLGNRTGDYCLLKKINTITLNPNNVHPFGEIRYDDQEEKDGITKIRSLGTMGAISSFATGYPNICSLVLPGTSSFPKTLDLQQFNLLNKLDLSHMTGHCDYAYLAKLLKDKPLIKLYFPIHAASGYVELTDDVMKSVRCILLKPQETRIIAYFPNLTSVRYRSNHNSACPAILRLPPTIKKVKAHNISSTDPYIKTNTSVTTFKCTGSYALGVYLEQLSQTDHVQQFIYQNNKTTPILDLSTINTNFKLDYAQSKFTTDKHSATVNLNYSRK
ncbi:hypothetical protein DFA_08950 [Cavenderia fasciculata]|uniref:Uncharacterized protein n=1 Tax=Cavenderia fasciculata TaxID=261658 RepID=F4Q556_CACFS|nr:uncharacterized protein DFA_08950 [Cavenderia fasciculata]EGG17949.1 hypothetical protein DFA_08950 [Cavenderia fasciculata]|eukprot:XP_004356433.1 hypothetical protein DFA_08950 [Cavenderia fasciculata]